MRGAGCWNCRRQVGEGKETGWMSARPCERLANGEWYVWRLSMRGRRARRLRTPETNGTDWMSDSEEGWGHLAVTGHRNDRWAEADKTQERRTS